MIEVEHVMAWGSSRGWGSSGECEQLRATIVGWLTTVTVKRTPRSSVVCFFWDRAETVV